MGWSDFLCQASWSATGLHISSGCIFPVENCEKIGASGFVIKLLSKKICSVFPAFVAAHAVVNVCHNMMIIH